MGKLRLTGLFLALWITSTLPLSAANPRKVSVDFYGHIIDLPYDGELKPMTVSFSKEIPARFNKALSASDYKPLINALLQEKSDLQLNDWLYYQLIKKTTQQLFPSGGQSYQIMMEWFILSRSGYSVKLLYDEQKPYVFVNTPDELLDVPFFMTKEGRYVNLSAINTPDEDKLQHLNAYETGEPQRGSAFLFSFTEKPAVLKQEVITKTLRFEHDGIVYSLPVSGDKSYISYLLKYPRLDLGSLPDFPVSDTTYRSVIPVFRKWIAGMSDAEAVRFILSFTRSAFAYETDEEAYHQQSIAFSPEMTLLSPYSDCEDRAILFAWMVKELLGRDVVLLEFPTHVAAAVNLPETYGAPITFNGETYSFCEATGPQNELEIGECDKRYTHTGFKVLRID